MRAKTCVALAFLFALPCLTHADDSFRTLAGHTDIVYSVAVSPDGQTVVSGGSADATIRLWRLSDGAPVRTITGAGWVICVAVTPDGQTILSGLGDTTVKLWSVADGTLVGQLFGHTDDVAAVAVTPDGVTAISGSNDATAKVWRLSDRQLLQTLTGHTGTVRALAVTPDGQTLASGSTDNTIRLWRLSDGQLLRTLTGHTGALNSLAVTPDGETLVSSGADQTIKIWRLSDGELLRTLTGHAATVSGIALTPDGETIVSGGDDNVIKVWRLADGTLLRTLSGHTGYVGTVAITPDGQTIVSGSGDYTVKLWHLENWIAGTVTTTTWTAANSPYRVTDTITVLDGNTLTIEPGVDVLFDADVQFIVQGSLHAVGTETDSIRFLKGLATEWGGIRISGGDSSLFVCARVSGAVAQGSAPDCHGGGIYVAGAGTRVGIHNTVVSGNRSEISGGGVVVTEGARIVSTAAAITDNVAGGAGGGLVAAHQASVTLTGCDVSGNTAPTNEGGGLHFYFAGGALTDCRVLHNVAATNSGGIRLIGANVTLARCLIAKNEAGSYGGGIWLSDASTAILTNCTISGNVGVDANTPAGGVGSWASQMTLSNSIVWGNASRDMDAGGGGTITATYCDLGQAWAGTGNINADPLFVSAVEGDFRLQAASPCIDAGDPVSPLDPDGTRADMGALAFFQSSAPQSPEYWSTGAPMPTPRWYHAAGAIGNKLYAVGGVPDDFSWLNTLEVYDSQTNAWTTGAPMPTVRGGLAAGVIDGKLYVVGGQTGPVNDHTSYNTLEIYDPVVGAWTTAAPMPTARGFVAAAAIAGKLYVVGGNDATHAILDVLEIYDPSTNTWTSGPAMPTARRALAAGVLDGKIYVVGGEGISGTLSTLEVYDPAANAWTTGPPMPTPRYCLAAAAMGGKLYVLGGENVPNSFLRSIDIYDPATAQWATGPQMPTARSGHAAATIGGRIYAVGGNLNANALGTLEIFGPPGVAGTVTTTTWTAANSPYRVTDTITVPDGNTLTIEPGVDVLFDADVQFIVQGSLHAVGTETDSIRFLKGTTTDWRGIRLLGTETNTLAYTRISGGNARGSEPEHMGGGLFVAEGTTVGLSNAVLSGNTAVAGGGVFSFGTADITDCVFSGNLSTGAWSMGGGVQNEGTMTVTDCTIFGNSAPTDSYGGGVGNTGTVDLSGCVVYGNTAGYAGGGVNNAEVGQLTMANCTVFGNTAPRGSGLYNYGTTAASVLQKSIIWGNTGAPQVQLNGGSVTATYSDIQGGYTGAGNIDLDPLFVDAAVGDFHLQAASPCVDAGDPASTLDPDGTVADMGAYFFDQGVQPPPPPMLLLPAVAGVKGVAVQAAVTGSVTECAGISLEFLVPTDVIENVTVVSSPFPEREISLIENTVRVGLASGPKLTVTDGEIVRLAFTIRADAVAPQIADLTFVPYPATEVNEQPATLTDGVLQVLNRAPVWTALADQEADPNTEWPELSFVIEATDPDGHEVSYQMLDHPTGAQFQVSTRTFTWRPVFEQAGDTLVVFRATDGYDAVNDTIAISVWDYYGDVTLDKTVVAFDASQVLKYSVRLEPNDVTTKGTLEVADVSDNGRATAYDAGLILHKAIVDWDFVFPARMPDAPGKPAQTAARSLVFVPAEGGWNLVVSQPDGVIGCDLELLLPEGTGAIFSGDGAIEHAIDGQTALVGIARAQFTNPVLLHVAGTAGLPQIVSASLNEGQIPLLLPEPVAFTLSQNTPNPFNPSTTLRFGLPEAGHVTLAVYDVNGRLVRNLVAGRFEAGQHSVTWDGRDNTGRAAASGAYLACLTAPQGTVTRRMVLAR